MNEDKRRAAIEWLRKAYGEAKEGKGGFGHYYANGKPPAEALWALTVPLNVIEALLED